MTRTPKPPPPPDRSWWFVWDMLSDSEKRQMRQIAGFAADWQPDSQRALTRKQRLEGLDELKRIMPMPPGRIGQMREDLIERVDPEGE